MALGDTIVDVIMQKISNRKMMSVIDAMLKVAVMRVLRFSAIGRHSLTGSLSRSMKASVFASSLFTTVSTFATR